MVLGRKQLAVFQLLRHPVQHIPVLCMNHGGDTLPSGGEKYIQDLVITKLQSLISHVYFQARDAFLNQSGEL